MSAGDFRDIGPLPPWVRSTDNPGMKIDSGDTAWVLASAALVMLMTPALGFFYGGLVRRKNVLSTIMHSFFILCLISVQWVLWGYSLAFGPDKFHIIGGLERVGLNNVGFTPNADYAPTIPHQAYMVFQMMFAVITPALISGAFAERQRFKAFVLFSLLWATFVYDPIAHWVWGAGGWLHNLGALDFAGGTGGHISSGVAACLLWFGWLGFNAGSAVAAGGLATSAFVVTNTATAMAALTWMTVSWWHKRQPSVLGAAAGAMAGLVAITPASGFVNVMGAIVIGFGAGVFCYMAIQLRERIHVDDALDVWAVHGIGGTWGALATGLFATVAINSAAANGLFYGNPKQVLIQLVAIGAAWGWSIVGTFVILKVVNVFVPLRVHEDEEILGLDLSQHGEPAYASINAN